MFFIRGDFFYNGKNYGCRWFSSFGFKVWKVVVVLVGVRGYGVGSSRFVWSKLEVILGEVGFIFIGEFFFVIKFFEIIGVTGKILCVVFLVVKGVLVFLDV